MTAIIQDSIYSKTTQQILSKNWWILVIQRITQLNNIIISNIPGKAEMKSLCSIGLRKQSTWPSWLWHIFANNCSTKFTCSSSDQWLNSSTHSSCFDMYESDRIALFSVDILVLAICSTFICHAQTYIFTLYIFRVCWIGWAELIRMWLANRDHVMTKAISSLMQCSFKHKSMMQWRSTGYHKSRMYVSSTQ